MKRLNEIISPWIETLKLPGKLVAWHGDELTLRGHSHYSNVRNMHAISDTYSPTPNAEDDWVMTVRGDHVEVRESNDEGPMVIAWHTIDAADPQFFEKLEIDLRAAIDYLIRS